ncbi:MAG: hypothetical protein K6B38_15360 [Ruminococcus sp.]|nr:hypothetical protein [Ruminococcus sp.]
MNDLKSISQIAVNLGVSRQAVYSKLKSAELARAVKPLTVKQGNTTLYTLQAQELIKQAFTAFAVNQESSNSQEEIDSLTSKLTESEKQLDKALHDIEVKSHELQEKEQRIKQLTEIFTTLDTLVTELKADKDKLNERLDKAEEQLTEKDERIQALTDDAATEREKDRNERQAILTQLFSLQAKNTELQTELNKYKALAESKQTVVEVDTVKERAPAEEQPTQEPAEDPPPQKLSFFQRLFRKDKNRNESR